MGLFDRFKKTKKGKTETKETPKIKAAKLTQKKEEPFLKEQTLDEALQKPVRSGKRIEKKQFSSAWQVLESPHVTEKSGMLAEKNQYVFKVTPSANKHQIKQAVQDLFGVAIERVRITNIPRKSRRVGKSEGFKSGYRKAIVKLVQGEKIELMPR